MVGLLLDFIREHHREIGMGGENVQVTDVFDKNGRLPAWSLKHL